ncbi:hypothetical protein T439DRAFT_1199 [Meredithblackwellia eburnea MCA 4105]
MSSSNGDSSSYEPHYPHITFTNQPLPPLRYTLPSVGPYHGALSESAMRVLAAKAQANRSLPPVVFPPPPPPLQNSRLTPQPATTSQQQLPSGTNIDKEADLRARLLKERKQLANSSKPAIQQNKSQVPPPPPAPVRQPSSSHQQQEQARIASTSSLGDHIDSAYSNYLEDQDQEQDEDEDEDELGEDDLMDEDEDEDEKPASQLAPAPTSATASHNIKQTISLIVNASLPPETLGPILGLLTTALEDTLKLEHRLAAVPLNSLASGDRLQWSSSTLGMTVGHELERGFERVLKKFEEVEKTVLQGRRKRVRKMTSSNPETDSGTTTMESPPPIPTPTPAPAPATSAAAAPVPASSSTLQDLPPPLPPQKRPLPYAFHDPEPATLSDLGIGASSNSSLTADSNMKTTTTEDLEAALKILRPLTNNPIPAFAAVPPVTASSSQSQPFGPSGTNSLLERLDMLRQRASNDPPTPSGSHSSSSASLIDRLGGTQVAIASGSEKPVINLLDRLTSGDKGKSSKSLVDVKIPKKEAEDEAIIFPPLPSPSQPATSSIPTPAAVVVPPQPGPLAPSTLPKSSPTSQAPGPISLPPPQIPPRDAWPGAKNGPPALPILKFGTTNPVGPLPPAPLPSYISKPVLPPPIPAAAPASTVPQPVALPPSHPPFTNSFPPQQHLPPYHRRARHLPVNVPSRPYHLHHDPPHPHHFLLSDSGSIQFFHPEDHPHHQIQLHHGTRHPRPLLRMSHDPSRMRHRDWLRIRIRLRRTRGWG